MIGIRQRRMLSPKKAVPPLLYTSGRSIQIQQWKTRGNSLKDERAYFAASTRGSLKSALPE